MNILKKIGGTIMLPMAMFLIMMILCFANGKMYFGTWKMWQTLIPDVALSLSCAFGIGLQFKAGRFDFSGGAIMLLAAIIAGNVAKSYGNNLLLMCLVCIVVCVILSLLVALLYVYGRLPIIIATIGMALLYESITCLIYKGSGINIISNMKLNVFSYYPKVLIPCIPVIIIYLVYSYLTKNGKQSELLANNQQSAVNIGINENKNVIVSYVFSGVIFGFATIIYIGNGMHNASFTSLSTAAELFSNILPVFIGLMLVGFCGEAIGTIMGALTLCLLSYGLNAVFSSELGAAITTICTGVFIFGLNVVSAQGSAWIHTVKKAFQRE